jgi:hypothetical protein
MSLISRSIAQLFGGVSQQPAQLRADSQCELQDNCWPDVAVGLTKRPPSVHIGKLSDSTDTERAVHFINRDATEKYTMLVKNGEIKVYDLLSGVEKTVTIADATSYLDSVDPKNDFAFLSVADTTYVVNKTITTQLESLGSTPASTMWATVRINSVPAEASYTNSEGTTQCTGAAVRIFVNGQMFSSLQTTGKTVANHVTQLTADIAAAFPTYAVSSDSATTITIAAPVGVPVAVNAYALDEYTSSYIQWGDDIQTIYSCNVAVNASRTTLKTGGSLNGYVGFVYVLAGVARQTYTVTLNGTDYSYTCAADGSDAKTDTIAAGLATAIGAATYTVTRLGSCLRIQKNDGASFVLTATDSYGDQGLMYFTDSVDSQAQLPPNFWPDFIIKVTGLDGSQASPLYVTFFEGVWKETVAPGLQNTPASATLPHKLVRNADGTFTFSRIEWDSRRVGDLDSNPAPSFVGQKINNLFFYRERLGFLSGENVVMSRVADYYNFFSATVSEVLDDDPIDATVADTRVSQLYHALSFQESLMIFSDAAQFQLTGGEVLSPKTVKLDATTRFYSSKVVPPVSAGRDIYFAVNRGNYTSMREYFVLPDGVNSDAVDVTAHVPSYIPKDLGGLVASTLLDALYMFSRSEPNKLYIHKYMWNGDQKAQTSWGTITFDSDVSIMGIETIDTQLYLVIRRADGTYLERMEFQSGAVETDMSFLVYLDRRYSLTGSYDALTKKTTWTLPHGDTSDTYQVVLGSSFGTQAGTVVQTTKVDTTTIEANGDVSSGACFVGKPYSMRYRFSQLFLKDGDKQSVMGAKLQLKTMGVSFSDTATFKAEVTPHLRDKSTYVFTGSKLGTASATIGNVNISSGEFRFPIITSSEGVVIDLVNDSPLPSTFQGAVWEGMYQQRTKRV